MRPELHIFAGPNGSGKSTLKDHAQKYGIYFPERYVNADDIKREYNLDNKAAADYAESLRLQYLKQEKSFTIETLLSTTQNTWFMKMAKRKGYRISLTYVLTHHPTININRVHFRRDHGGHFIPDDKVVERYYRSLALLPEAIFWADRMQIWDNTQTAPWVICQKSNSHRYRRELSGSIIFYPKPLWDTERIRNLIKPAFSVMQKQKPNRCYRYLLHTIMERINNNAEVDYAAIDKAIVKCMVDMKYAKTLIHDAIVQNSPANNNLRYAENLLKEYLT